MNYQREMSASSLTGYKIFNTKNEELGKIEEIMIEVNTGRIAYAVLSFGGLLGIGDKLFAIPWSALRVAPTSRRLILDIDKETLEAAPGFDKNNWPDLGTEEYGRSVYRHFGQTYPT